MSNLAYHAVQYLEAGHHLIALTGKRPSQKFHAKPDDETPGWSWERSIYGTPETEEEVAALYQVFDDPTTTGIGLLIPEHFLVADIDTEEAAVLWTSLVPEVPETVSAKTPNGVHLWFFSPGADQNVWMGGRTLLFKGFGGYVAAPPSAHFNSDGVQDGVYTWIRGLDTGFEGLPVAVEKRLKFERALDRLEPVKTVESGMFVVVKWPLMWPSWHIEGLCKAIREAPDGNQNNMIAWAAMQARDEGVPFTVAMPLLLSAAVEGGHPRDRARTTIKSAFTRKRRG